MKRCDYIVIGSGIAGLHTAYRLKQQNKSVLVLEKETYVGGRMSSHEIDGFFFDFGAKFILSVYKYMLPLAKDLGVESVPIHLTKAAIRKNGVMYYFDGAKSIFAVLSYKGVSLKAKLRLGFALLRAWLKYHRTLDVYEMGKSLFLDDKSIYDDLRNAAGAEGFDHLIESLSRNVIFYRTKELSRAAFYSLLPKLTGTMKSLTFPKGIGELCEIMAMQVSVERGVEVTSVRRTEDGVVVKSIHNGQEKNYRAENVVIAVPGNRVLGILGNPTPDEKSFFSQVRYASTVQILCKGKTDLFKKADIIWTLPKEQSSFTSIGGCRDRHVSSSDSLYFSAALREETFLRLREEGRLRPDILKELIQSEFPTITEMEIIRIQIWESATPKIYPGYSKKVIQFLNEKDWGNHIYFCGDYLENPSTEGALTSSIKLLERVAKGVH